MFLAGNKFKAKQNIEVHVLTQWRAAFTGGNKAILPKGEIVQVIHDAPKHATGAACKPVNYDSLHSTLVPESDRTAEKYDGYYLAIPFGELNAKFEKEE